MGRIEYSEKTEIPRGIDIDYNQQSIVEKVDEEQKRRKPNILRYGIVN
jgi:hypothetical protein